MARASTGKRLRFEILKRDGFKCRYCGIDAVAGPLQVDHVIPVAEGGSTVAENLVAACSSCNGGKSSVLLDESRVGKNTPTSAMREHAKQIRAYLSAVKERDLAMNEMSEYVLSVWTQNVGSYIQNSLKHAMPSHIAEHGLDAVMTAIYALAKADIGNTEERSKYFYGVLRNLRKAR